ncbi:hypothetical protein DUI87_14576 [Hirundo rustica rustica]|uniref:Uncharacterized protein n=1 Tax=Hirundo rustica rustica TaxID=333673 RepID=A0A3M0K541_HIRRU|nr:hypothetical protein DUI87_14576 [Hirundo rustica rustica]
MVVWVCQKNSNSWRLNVWLEATRGSQKAGRAMCGACGRGISRRHVGPEMQPTHAETDPSGLAFAVESLKHRTPQARAVVFSFGLRKPIVVLRRSPMNGRLLSEKVTTCSWKTDPGNRDWKLFLHQKGQSQAKGVIGKERKDSSERVKKVGAQEQVLEEMVLTNANEKAAILSLSMEPAPGLDDMLQVCAKKVPFITAHQSHSSRVNPPQKAAIDVHLGLSKELQQKNMLGTAKD